MTIANITLAVLIFFGCEAVLLTALWKRARHSTIGTAAACREIIDPISRAN